MVLKQFEQLLGASQSLGPGVPEALQTKCKTCFGCTWSWMDPEEEKRHDFYISIQISRHALADLLRLDLDLKAIVFHRYRTSQHLLHLLHLWHRCPDQRSIPTQRKIKLDLLPAMKSLKMLLTSSQTTWKTAPVRKGAKISSLVKVPWSDWRPTMMMPPMYELTGKCFLYSQSLTWICQWYKGRAREPEGRLHSFSTFGKNWH